MDDDGLRCRATINGASYLFTRREIQGEEVKFLGSKLWHGDLAYLAFLAAIVVASYFSYRWIEKPAAVPRGGVIC